MVQRLRGDLHSLYAARRKIQERNGIAAGMEGTCHHLLGDGTAIDELVFSLPLHSEILEFFGGPYILNSIGGFINDPEGRESYIGRIHRDIRTYAPHFRLMVNMLIMLDDFTVENGATSLLPGSHSRPEEPPQDTFSKESVQALGSAGDILLFDSRVWHAAGQNRSAAPRRALTLTYTRPFFKQQLDYPGYLGEDYARNLPEQVRQVLGYRARVPDSIDAFYQPPHKRSYQSDQG